MLFDRTTITSIDVMLDNTCPAQVKIIFFVASLCYSGVRVSTVFCNISARSFRSMVALWGSSSDNIFCTVFTSESCPTVVPEEMIFDSYSVFMSLTGTVSPGETTDLAVKAHCFPAMWSTGSTILSPDGIWEPIGTQTLPGIMTSLLGGMLTVLAAVILKQPRNPSIAICFSCHLIMSVSLLTSTQHLFFFIKSRPKIPSIFRFAIIASL